jgi:hypothetical protein
VAAEYPPNVRAVRSIEEREELNKRYEKAISSAKSKGCLKAVEAFQSALKSSWAVIGSDLHVIRQLVTNDKALYNNYFTLVNANFRKPARADDERRRRVADAILLDGYQRHRLFGTRVCFCISGTKTATIAKDRRLSKFYQGVTLLPKSLRKV